MFRFYFYLSLLLPMLAGAQDDVVDMRVAKHSIDIIPDTPYLIDGHVYRFAIRETYPAAETRVRIDRGAVNLHDTILIVKAEYTKGERNTEPDSAILSFTMRDGQQRDIGHYRKIYTVYNAFTKPQKGKLKGLYFFAGDWNFGSYGGGFDTTYYIDKIFANMDKEFTYSDVASRPDTTRKVTGITMTILTHYHTFHVAGDRLSAEMLRAIRDEKNGCEFTLELFIDGSDIRQSMMYLDTRRWKPDRPAQKNKPQ